MSHRWVYNPGHRVWVGLIDQTFTEIMLFEWFNDWFMLAKIKGLIGWLKLLKVQLKGLILSPQVGFGVWVRMEFVWSKIKIRVLVDTPGATHQVGGAAHHCPVLENWFSNGPRYATHQRVGAAHLHLIRIFWWMCATHHMRGATHLMPWLHKTFRLAYISILYSF